MRNNGWIIEADPSDWHVVNTKKDGGRHHYGVKAWGGAGYILDLFSVWADSPEEALTLVGEWCEKNLPGLIIRDTEVMEEVNNWILEEVQKNPREYSLSPDKVDDMGDEEILSYIKSRGDYWDIYDRVTQDNYLDEWVYATDNPEIYLRAENLWFDDWPSDYPSPEDVKESKHFSGKKRRVFR